MQTFGGNIIYKGTKYCIFSGDVNNDGSINLDDENLISDDYSNFVTGYVNTDVNGDFIVNLTDLSIAYNNSNNFVSVIHP